MTIQTLNNSLSQVHDELYQVGFLTDAVYEVDVHLSSFGLCWGYYLNGDIHIVNRTVRDVLSWCIGRCGEWRPCRDTLRHEFGHAVWDKHCRVVRQLKGKSVFSPSRQCDDTYCDCIMTSYGETDAEEDFCEMFSIFVQRAGRMPSSVDCPVIRDKWRFIRRLGKQLNND